MYGELQRMKADYENQKELLSWLEEEYAIAPAGTLYAKHRRGKYYYYHVLLIDGKKKHIFLSENKEADRRLLERLQRKLFAKKSIPVLKGNLIGLSRCLELYKPYDSAEICNQAAVLVAGFKKKRPRLMGEFDQDEWCQNDEMCNYRQEERKYETVGGLKVRSKSESIIAIMLDKYNVIFKYEPSLRIGETLYRPDFGLIKPWNMEKAYWEHFGMLDNDEYVAKTVKKIIDYRNAGFILGKNFYATFETGKEGINVQEVQNIIENSILGRGVHG